MNMVSLVKYTALPLTSPDSSSHVPRPQLCTLPSVHNVQQSTQPSLSSLKPLYISSTQNFAFRRRRVPECQAYEADRSRPLELNIELPDEEAGIEATQRIKIGLYFATWWALNVVFNIYNKKVLNAFPYPWLTSTLSLAAGSLMMLISWATKVAELPKVDFQFWKALFPVAVLHTIGHVAATVSMSKVAVSFTHIIKSAEPAFSVLVSRFLLGEAFPGQVYLSLVPIIGGCALAAVTELNFNMIGFMGAMISNLAFVLRNIFSKKGMKGMSVSGMNYYACLSILSLLILTPFAIAVEGPKMWAAGWQTALSEIGPNFVWWVAAQSVFYHLYNQVSYMSLDQISPLTFSIGNTMKRISVIVSSILIFHTPIQPVNALGAAIAILGTFLYSQALHHGFLIHLQTALTFAKNDKPRKVWCGYADTTLVLLHMLSDTNLTHRDYINFHLFSLALLLFLPGSISDESNGDVAVDQYHRFIFSMPCCSAQLAMAKCSEGDSEKEPFIAAHNVILSHAAAVDIHRTKCQVLGPNHIWKVPYRDGERSWKPFAQIFQPRKRETQERIGFHWPQLLHGFYVQDCMYSACKLRPGISRTEGSYKKNVEKNGVPIGEPERSLKLITKIIDHLFSHA
ncbi:hypothetical protein JHK87_045972 [Glycine soja]|nr:hypothetical protein JHK87_045972 [Glycine soja]